MYFLHRTAFHFSTNFSEKSILPSCVIKLSSLVHTRRPTHPHNFLLIFLYRDMGTTISIPEGTHPEVDDGECRHKSLHMSVSFMWQIFLLKTWPDMTSNFWDKYFLLHDMTWHDKYIKHFKEDKFLCHKVFLQHYPYLQWYFPSHNNTIYTLNYLCWSGLLWEILGGDLIIFLHILNHILVSSYSGVLQTHWMIFGTSK